MQKQENQGAVEKFRVKERENGGKSSTAHCLVSPATFGLHAPHHEEDHTAAHPQRSQMHIFLHRMTLHAPPKEDARQITMARV